MCSSARSDLTGPTPARTQQRWSSPRSRTCCIQRAKIGTSKMNCVWHELCAGRDLLAQPLRPEALRRRERVLDGADEPARRRRSARGRRAACFWSRSVRAVQTSWIESRSKTGFASGWSPKRGWSPVSSRTFGMPSAARRAGRPARRCGSGRGTGAASPARRPPACAARLPAQLARRATALWPSVMLAASIQSRRSRALRRMARHGAPRGGPISAVTANRPP